MPAKKIHENATVKLPERAFPAETTLWAGTVDDEINSHSYIVPGLGDAGDLAYGVKE